MIIDAEMLERVPVEARYVNHPYRASATIAGIELQLHTDSAELARAFESYYRDQRGDAWRRFSFVVETTESGYLFASDNGGFRWKRGRLNTDALMFLVDAAAVSSLIDSDPQITSFHAAAIAWHGRAAAIAGASNAGKTTTLLACARAGCDVYTDERTILRDGIVVPFLRTCSTRGEGKRLLLADGRDDALARQLAIPERLSLVETFGDRIVARPLPLSFLFTIAGYGAEPVVAARCAVDALPAVTRWYRAQGGPFDRLRSALELLKSLRVFDLTLGTPAATARAIALCMESFDDL